MNIFCLLTLLFFTYAFIGWCIEVSIGIFSEKKFINRGFLIGPIVPIWGLGGILIYLLLDKYSDDPLVLFLLATFLCATLEYITSWLMEKIFKNRWWDYSHMKFNINGRICLEFATGFGMGGIVMTYLINPFLTKIYNLIPIPIVNLIVIFLLILLIIDVIISFNILINLKNISKNIKTDSTEALTKKVKEILISKTYPYRRLLQSFPDMIIFNKISILKDKIKNAKNEIKLAKHKEKLAKHLEKIKKKVK